MRHDVIFCMLVIQRRVIDIMEQTMGALFYFSSIFPGVLKLFENRNYI